MNSAVATQKTKKSHQELIDEINKLREKLREPELVEPEVFVTDITPETLEAKLAEQNERVAILTDEGNLFSILSGMYAGGKQNLDVFLKGHAGGALRVRRQGRVHDLNKIAVTIGLIIQTEVINEIDDKASRGFRGKGLLARFLPYLPKSNIGTRDIRKRKAIPAEVAAKYTAGIKALLNIPSIQDGHNIEVPRGVMLTPEAHESFEHFSQWVEDNQGDGKPFQTIQDFTAKLPGSALRVAGVSHVAEKVHTLSSLSALPPIGKNCIEKAQDLCETLIPHFQKFCGLLGDDPVIADAQYALEWIVNNGRPDADDEQQQEHPQHLSLTRSASHGFLNRMICTQPPDSKNRNWNG